MCLWTARLNEWDPFSINFTASNSQSLLRFQSQITGDDAYGIDGIRLFVTRCQYAAVFESEWPLLAADLGIELHEIATPNKRIPERFGIAMVRHILCNPRHPHHANTLSAYSNNAATLENEAPAAVSSVAPYRHALVAVLLINQARQDHFKSAFGLLGTYEVVRPPGTKELATRSFLMTEILTATLDRMRTNTT
jgi:hypothetical protein